MYPRVTALYVSAGIFDLQLWFTVNNYLSSASLNHLTFAEKTIIIHN